MALTPFRSPLRYPGGKRKLASYICRLYELNGLCDGDYVEPYCGGASIAWALLSGEYAFRVFLNDADPAVFAFWHSVLYETEALSQLITDMPVTVQQWQQQRYLLTSPDASQLARGFAAFFLNRTNHSGILRGGLLGGQAQAGPGKLDARFNRQDLVRRIHKIARYGDRISVSNLDAVPFLHQTGPKLRARSLIYLDPPYYVKGPSLYAKAYGPHEHAAVATAVAGLAQRWVVSYDNAPQVLALYQQYDSLQFSFNYTAQARYQGGEVLFFSPGLRRPELTAKMLPLASPLLSTTNNASL